MLDNFRAAEEHVFFYAAQAKVWGSTRMIRLESYYFWQPQSTLTDREQSLAEVDIESGDEQ